MDSVLEVLFFVKHLYFFKTVERVNFLRASEWKKCYQRCLKVKYQPSVAVICQETVAMRLQKGGKKPAGHNGYIYSFTLKMSYCAFGFFLYCGKATPKGVTIS